MKNIWRARLVGIAASLRRWWRELAQALRPWRIEGAVTDMDRVPVRIPARRAVLVATADRRKWLVFDCPCRSGHRIMLNLDRAREPFWTLRVSRKGRFSLFPSVDYRDFERSCHYFVSNGRVAWAAPVPAGRGIPREVEHA